MAAKRAQTAMVTEAAAREAAASLQPSEAIALDRDALGLTRG